MASPPRQRLGTALDGGRGVGDRELTVPSTHQRPTSTAVGAASETQVAVLPSHQMPTATAISVISDTQLVTPAAQHVPTTPASQNVPDARPNLIDVADAKQCLFKFTTEGVLRNVVVSLADDVWTVMVDEQVVKSQAHRAASIRMDFEVPAPGRMLPGSFQTLRSRRGERSFALDVHKILVPACWTRAGHDTDVFVPEVCLPPLRAEAGLSGDPSFASKEETTKSDKAELSEEDEHGAMCETRMSLGRSSTRSSIRNESELVRRATEPICVSDATLMAETVRDTLDEVSKLQVAVERFLTTVKTEVPTFASFPGNVNCDDLELGTARLQERLRGRLQVTLEGKLSSALTGPLAELRSVTAELKQSSARMGGAVGEFGPVTQTANSRSDDSWTASSSCAKAGGP